LGKTAKNIEYYLDLKNDKDYLQDLLLNIKKAFINQENLTFRIVEPKERGFLIKVGGLFAFVSFKHFGWKYPSIEFWRNASNSIVGKFFTGKIHNVEENPISIQIDAKEQKFENPNLEKYSKYRGIILQKPNYGVFVDLGFHFNWKFGSILGLIHISTFMNESDYENCKLGDEIETVFQGLNENNQPILGDYIERGKWTNGEMEKLIGTIQKVSVLINEDEKPEFYVLGKHKATIPINKALYPNFRTTAKKYTYGLKNGEIIDCEIVKINSKKDSFVLKLTIEPPTK
jgi:ribosomal protein S1